MKNNFRKWTDVYKFTLHQSVSKKGFQVVSILVALVLIAGIVIISVFTAKPDKIDDEQFPIEKVYVLDQSGFEETDYSSYLQRIDDQRFKHINFESVANLSSEQVIEKYAKEFNNSIVVIVSVSGDRYEMEGVIKEGSPVSEWNVEILLQMMSEAFNINKMTQVGLTPEKLTMIMTPIVTSYSEVGQDTSFFAIMMKTIAPMLFGLVLYFLLLFHGMTISKEVSTEKTSKLVETLITTVHPYALITGKVLAISSVAVIQFLSWIIAGIAGLYGGNALARSIYPEYESSVVTIIEMFRDTMGETALSIPAIILAFIIFSVGFLFYCVLAGLAGCMVSRPEDAASTQSLYQFPIIISWLTCYLSSALGRENIIEVARYVPFTAPFSTPIDLIVGNIGLISGLISALILILFSIGTIVLSARIYKGMILYSGQKVNFKTIINTIKG
ncbi:UNVERIFIED_CONTAM: ABC-type Na+ efflux pump permease subunit [Acetivibrio alkalicellulosi]